MSLYRLFGVCRDLRVFGIESLICEVFSQYYRHPRVL